MFDVVGVGVVVVVCSCLSVLAPLPRQHASKVGTKLQRRNPVDQFDECDVRLSENQLRDVATAAGGRADVPES